MSMKHNPGLRRIAGTNAGNSKKALGALALVQSARALSAWAAETGNITEV